MDRERTSLSDSAASPQLPVPGSLSICYALADQSLRRTKSVGIYNLSLGLLTALARHPQLGRLHVLSSREVAGFLPSGPRITMSEHNRAVGGKISRIWWDQIGLARAARRSGCDWTYLPKGYMPWRTRLPGRVACYVHDAIHVFYRDHHAQWLSRLDLAYFALSLRTTLRRAHVVFTNSEFSRQELLGYATEVRLPAPPIVVAGIGFDLPPAAPLTKGGGIVCIASRWPHKRTDLAVEYLGRWQRETGYAGTVDWVGSAPEQVTWPACPNWRRHSRLDHAAYHQLVTASGALVYCSEHEGFGMPPVEAVLLGTCPVYSRLPATTEVMAGRGQPFDNEDYNSFRQALNQALQTPPHILTAWAETLRTRFSWAAVAERVAQGLLAARASGSAGDRH